MRVYLIQHGKAVDESVDPARPLSNEGIKQTEKIASVLGASGLIKISRIYHSDKLRSKQTAYILANHLQPAQGLELMEGIKPNDSPGACVNILKSLNEDVMIAGHLPHMSRAASMLLTGEMEKMLVMFRNSGVICLERADNAWFVAPLFVF